GRPAAPRPAGRGHAVRRPHALRSGGGRGPAGATDRGGAGPAPVAAPARRADPGGIRARRDRPHAGTERQRRLHPPDPRQGGLERPDDPGDLVMTPNEDWTDLSDAWKAPRDDDRALADLARQVRRRSRLGRLNYVFEMAGCVVA